MLSVVAVTSLNHYTTQERLRYFTEVEKRDTREFFNMLATQQAQLMGTQALAVTRIQANQVESLQHELADATKFAVEMHSIAVQQKAYIEALLDALDANGAEPPPPPTQPDPPPKPHTASYKEPLQCVTA